MEVGPDGMLYLPASRYNVVEQPDYSDAVIFRINAQGNMVGVDNPEPVQAEINVYPNPGRDKLHIRFGGQNNALFQLYNMQGKLIKTHRMRNNTIIHTQELPSGIYLYRIIGSNDKIYTGKWIKQ